MSILDQGNRYDNSVPTTLTVTNVYRLYAWFVICLYPSFSRFTSSTWTTEKIVFLFDFSRMVFAQIDLVAIRSPALDDERMAGKQIESTRSAPESGTHMWKHLRHKCRIWEYYCFESLHICPCKVTLKIAVCMSNLFEQTEQAGQVYRLGNISKLQLVH